MRYYSEIRREVSDNLNMVASPRCFFADICDFTGIPTFPIPASTPTHSVSLSLESPIRRFHASFLPLPKLPIRMPCHKPLSRVSAPSPRCILAPPRPISVFPHCTCSFLPRFGGHRPMHTRLLSLTHSSPFPGLILPSTRPSFPVPT